MRQVCDLLDARIAEVDTAIAELHDLRDTLAATRSRAAACTDEQPAIVCPIIEDVVGN